MNDWQSWAAGAVVMVTAAIFVARAIRRKKGGCPSCGGGDVKRR